MNAKRLFLLSVLPVLVVACTRELSWKTCRLEDGEDLVFGMPEPNGNFSVSEEGVTWTYNPYEIAPYAMGAIELAVRWSDLKPYLK